MMIILLVIGALLFVAGCYTFVGRRYGWACSLWAFGLLLIALAGWLILQQA
jgi:hypothetical protein